jgi:hypothetical protein
MFRQGAHCSWPDLGQRAEGRGHWRKMVTLNLSLDLTWRQT